MREIGCLLSRDPRQRSFSSIRMLHAWRFRVHVAHASAPALVGQRHEIMVPVQQEDAGYPCRCSMMTRDERLQSGLVYQLAVCANAS